MSGGPHRTPQQILFEARALADRHGMFFAEVYDKDGDRYVTEYVLYRRTPGNGRGVRLGKRRDPAALLRLIRDCAGVAA